MGVSQSGTTSRGIMIDKILVAATEIWERYYNIPATMTNCPSLGGQTAMGGQRDLGGLKQMRAQSKVVSSLDTTLLAFS